jgi:hypothetical protein
MREQKLNELQGASRLTLGFFNRLIRRIECTKPLAGSGISIKEDDNGFTLSTSGGDISGAQRVTLNVCSNGVPASIIVFGIV